MEILHQFPIQAPAARVYAGVTTPAGLDRWWTARSSGSPVLGTTYELWFGAEYDWRATVTQCDTDRAFELELTAAMPDWIGTRVGFRLEPDAAGTMLRFTHSGWAGNTEHFRISSFCWAMYLRILRRYLEYGETVPYEERLSV